MVGTGSPVSFRRRPPLTSRGGPDCQSSATAFTPVWAHVSAWGPARHDNHEGQRMTPGAPTDGARSRFPGYRGSAEAGTTLKDSGKRRHSSKGVHCGSPLIDEAGAASSDRFLRAPPVCPVTGTSILFQGTRCYFCGTGGARRRLPTGPSRVSDAQCHPRVVPSGRSRIGYSSTFSAPASSIEALGSTVITACALRVR